jgi:hypothetical protein
MRARSASGSAIWFGIAPPKFGDVIDVDAKPAAGAFEVVYLVVDQAHARVPASIPFFARASLSAPFGIWINLTSDTRRSAFRTAPERKPLFLPMTSGARPC